MYADGRDDSFVFVHMRPLKAKNSQGLTQLFNPDRSKITTIAESEKKRIAHFHNEYQLNPLFN